MRDYETIRDDFLAFLEERDCSLSYKMPFLLSFLERMDFATGATHALARGKWGTHPLRQARGVRVSCEVCPPFVILGHQSTVRESMLRTPSRNSSARDSCTTCATSGRSRSATPFSRA